MTKFIWFVQSNLCNIMDCTNQTKAAMQPTHETYGELQQAFDHFNIELFDSKLPPCLLTLQREKKTYGYFSAERFGRRGDDVKTDEIALNPAYFGVVPVIEVMQTIAHEMVHLWQHHFGVKAGRRRYHNKEWAEKMESIGLMPSDTGKPGGKKVGERMSDYPINGGAFMQASDKLLTQHFHISWFDRFPAKHVTAQALELATDDEDGEGADLAITEESQTKPTRAKYTCPTCSTNVWGKPALKLVCGECNGHYEVNESP